MASIETKLERLDKEELITLIRRMIERHADLDQIVGTGDAYAEQGALTH